ncbi:MAG: GvpL/GvpF family gas vesicle protein [Planctomycetota bacterium]
MQQTAPDTCAAWPASSQGVYLYCFVRRTVAGRIKTTGVEDHTEVASLAVGDIAAVFSMVSLGAFTGPSGDANLSDVSWIVPRARRHERVVEEVMQLSPVLPARFGTVFSSTAVLERLLAKNADKIGQFLEQMAGREEWSVKTFLDVPKAEAWLRTSQAAFDGLLRPGILSPGLRYIRDKQACVHARRRLEDWTRRTAEEVERLLATHAVDVRPLRPQPTGTTGNAGKLLLNSALLVLKDRAAELHERAREIEVQYADQGLSLSVSGPWPPYSFCPSVLDVEPCE